MRIKKIYQGSVPENKIVGTYTETNTDTYSCNYINNNLLQSFLDAAHPIGSYYETNNANFDPNVSFVGTWVREDDGTTLVSYKSSGAFNKSIGTTTGTETVTLTEGQLPNIQGTLPHVAYGENKITGHFIFEQDGNTHYEGQAASVSNNSRYRLNFGNNESHNNIQPSKVIYRWHRTA